MLKTAKAKIIASAAGIVIVGGIAAAIITITRNKEKDPATAVNITTEGAFTTEADAEPSDTTAMTDDTSAEENTENAAPRVPLSYLSTSCGCCNIISIISL